MLPTKRGDLYLWPVQADLGGAARQHRTESSPLSADHYLFDGSPCGVRRCCHSNQVLGACCVQESLRDGQRVQDSELSSKAEMILLLVGLLLLSVAAS